MLIGMGIQLSVGAGPSSIVTVKGQSLPEESMPVDMVRGSIGRFGERS